MRNKNLLRLVEVGGLSVYGLNVNSAQKRRIEGGVSARARAVGSFDPLGLTEE